MDTLSIQYFKTPLGELIMGSYNNELCLCDWRYRKMRLAVDNRIKTQLKVSFHEEESQIIDIAKQQIGEYLEGERKIFEMPLLMVGTDFQQNVWNALLKIPYGETESYIGLARKLNKEAAIRAVAAANGANPLAIFVPCHRIIGSDGSLVGYAGGLNIKKKMLQLESNKQNPEQLELFNE